MRFDASVKTSGGSSRCWQQSPPFWRAGALLSRELNLSNLMSVQGVGRTTEEKREPLSLFLGEVLSISGQVQERMDEGHVRRAPRALGAVAYCLGDPARNRLDSELLDPP